MLSINGHRSLGTAIDGTLPDDPAGLIIDVKGYGITGAIIESREYSPLAPIPPLFPPSSPPRTFHIARHLSFPVRPRLPIRANQGPFEGLDTRPDQDSCGMPTAGGMLPHRRCLATRSPPPRQVHGRDSRACDPRLRLGRHPREVLLLPDRWGSRTAEAAPGKVPRPQHPPAHSLSTLNHASCRPSRRTLSLSATGFDGRALPPYTPGAEAWSRVVQEFQCRTLMA